jgi:hypothetical protein
MTLTRQTGTRVQPFRNAVRSRDRRCVISGEEADRPDYSAWWGFGAAHIFPLSHEGLWKQYNFDRWISLSPVKGGTINSLQNGMLLRCDIHQLFDNYAFSINPDVCIPNITFSAKVANDYLRIITRSYSS